MKALICGVSGQDGAYLAQLLLKKGYQVIGTSRDASGCAFRNLNTLNINSNVLKESMTINDFRSVLEVLQKHKPDEIYNLSGQTSVGLSYSQPVEAIESIAQGTLNILEAIRFLNLKTRFYNAGSGECYGDTGFDPVTEESPFRPKSPYAVAKATAHWLVKSYRESYKIYAVTGILFNHESPLRPERFVTQKIVQAALNIKNGMREVLTLGNLNIIRDWGWAPEYVEAMWLMLQLNNPEDFIVATGKSHSLEYFVSKVFATLDLDWKEHVRIDEKLFRPSDISTSYCSPKKANEYLNWQAKVGIERLIENMCKPSHGMIIR
jgi:GDPmannose 4,6-dehydratase